jgi:hypothetical protein
MTRVTCFAQSATPAPGVNLSDHTPPDKLRRCGSAFDHADELMPERAFKPRVASRDLHIRIANPAQGDAHDRLTPDLFVRAHLRLRNLRHGQPAALIA